MSDRSSEFTRRKFIKSGAGLIAAAGLTTIAPGLAKADTAAKESDKKQGAPVERILGRTGLKMPVVSMGVGAANSPELVAACWDIGMRHFDTAAIYQDGQNEQMVGKVIKRLKIRDKAIIGTKIFAKRENVPDDQIKKRLFAEIDESLKRLGTDYVDILYVHSAGGTGVGNRQALIEGMSELKKSGKTRFIGISTHRQMATVLNEAVAAKVWDVVLTSINFTMANNNELLGAIKNASDNGVGLVAMKTQAGGASFPNPETLKNYSAQTVNRAALKWAMKNDYLTTAITGISNFDHLRENFAVAEDMILTDEESKFLADNKITLGFGFCQQCDSCLPTCPHSADIPTLVRTHMYAAQYSDLDKARRVLDNIPAGMGLSECANCTSCVASCANSVNIPHRINELKLMYS